MPSATYDLFVRAMVERKQILCTYGGYPRQLCPIILGHSQGQEKALTYQRPVWQHRLDLRCQPIAPSHKLARPRGVAPLTSDP
jgi:hypothetical protein